MGGDSNKVASEWRHKVGVSNKVASEWKHKVGVSNKVAFLTERTETIVLISFPISG